MRRVTTQGWEKVEGMATDQISKHTEDDEHRFLTVRERSYKYGKGKN